MLAATAGGAAAIVAWRSGVFKWLSPDEKKADDKPSEALSEIDAIRLPEISMNSEPLDWNLDERIKLFFPEGVDKSKLTLALKAAKKAFIAARILFTTAKNPEERKESFLSLLVALNGIYGELVGEKEKLVFTDDELNHLLLMGDMMMVSGGGNLSMYEVDDVHSLTIKFNSQTNQIPVIFVKNQIRLNTQQDSAVDSLGGVSLENGKYIAICRKNLVKGIMHLINEVKRLCQEGRFKCRVVGSSQTIINTISEQTIMHEAMHAAFGISGIGNKEVIKSKGDIHMGRYILREREYSDFLSNAIYANELVGLGMGLSKSGNLARFIANFHTTDQYGLARLILRKEIENSPYTDEHTRQQIESDGLHFNDTEKIPDEELHAIGERMAKLGIYLLH